MEPLAPFNGTSPAMSALGRVLPRAGALHVRPLEHVLHEPAADGYRGRASARIQHHRSGADRAGRRELTARSHLSALLKNRSWLPGGVSPAFL